MKAALIPACLCILLLSLWGCTASLEQRAETLCSGCSKLILDPDPDIPLIAYTRLSDSSHVLHVYLEGDGVPWDGFKPNRNPTSSALTALSLMQADPYSSAYINRPCYGWADMPGACHPALWTDERYSAHIVDRMNRALDELVQITGTSRLILFGHSGGGTLAMLLAQDRKDVRGIVTVAANLDHRAWTHMRGFQPLTGSLNPVELPPLGNDVVRIHLAGGADRQVSADILAYASRHDPRAMTRIYNHFDHHCCWQDVWPAIIREVRLRISKTGTLPDVQLSPEGMK